MSQSPERNTWMSDKRTAGQRSGAAIRRLLAPVSCASLLVCALCWVSLGETAEPVRAPGAANADLAATQGSARQLYAEGREHYLRGRFAAAVASLEAAQSLAADLPGPDRARLHQYLERARAKIATPSKTGGLVARAQSADGASDAASSPADDSSDPPPPLLRRQAGRKSRQPTNVIHAEGRLTD